MVNMVNIVNIRRFAGAIVAAVLLIGYASTPADAATSGSAGTSSVQAARPRNGAILYAGITGGEGILKVKNGTKNDAVVTLVKGKSKAISVYVHAKSSATVRDVRDGTYRIFFTTGSRFSTSKGRFGRNAVYQRFDDRLTFTTTTTRSTIWTLTLNPIKGGNARTKNINPSDFPA